MPSKYGGQEMLTISDKFAGYAKYLFPEESPESRFEKLIENELIRRLSRYRNTQKILESKYKMDFETFKANNILKKEEYSFDVENDFCDWEMAIDGIQTMERKLKDLRG